ncbi:ChaC-like protein-domain-containing protein [Diplogelasinospora grovesii]|uniref:glutathione-specific gamma-glutamylcyclotransferase n=1 Tax=Diplogelasinospora grovesii TaxID=303347 RepID=A0AAN6S1K8_9PEZI|nr:ChaC-like protein-domain-containing protein [Diplogelasinospora grovesii]
MPTSFGCLATGAFFFPARTHSLLLYVGTDKSDRSLIWKPPPHFDRRIPGWVTGYVRRFWQASQDHRGTPEAPGRVVTLIERAYWETLADHHDSSPDGKVWGVAYRILADKVAEVKEHLDIREINGYTIHFTPFHPAPASTTTALPIHPIKALVYIGTPENDQFIHNPADRDPQRLAAHIYHSIGPSGLNRDYLWNLETALNELSPESGDEHVTDLSNRCRMIAAAEADEENMAKEQEEEHRQHGHFRRVSSVDEQEETEKTS